MNQLDRLPRSGLTAVLLFAAAFTVPQPIHAMPAPEILFDDEDETDRGCSACTRSARSTHRACGHELLDDYWIDFARCLQYEDEDDREECIAEARAARGEAREQCRAQFDARREVCRLVGESPYDPELEPEDFLSPEETADNPNPYFPLVPGTRWVYDAGDETNEVVVTEFTREVEGIECTVIHDVVSVGGVLVEDTVDWYAQDDEGNVWYFGEFVKNFEDGELVDLDGSWTAGVEDAKAGIIMKADPESGETYRQEFWPGEAEDLGQVLSVTASESAPAASCDGDCVAIRDFTPIEPGHEGHKYYAPGIGLILEIFPKTGEREELIEFEQPGRGAALSAPRTDVLLAASISPNPARTGTSFRFALPHPSQVRIDVFDVSGRRVRALHEGAADAGKHAVEWDGFDETRRAVAPGVYFIRLSADGGEITKDVVILR